MKGTIIIWKKEIFSYLSSPMAYIITCVFLLLSGTFFIAYLVGTNYGDTSIQGFLNAAQFLILLFTSILTMRLISEEKKLATWEFLLTCPVKDIGIILGKFLGSLTILLLMLALTLFYPLMLILLGDPDLGPIATSYIGLILLGSSCLAAGIFSSSVSSNQIVAVVLSGGILFGLWFLGPLASLIPGPLGEALSLFSLSHYFTDFIIGIIDTRAVIYYLSITVFFLYMATRSIEAGRWQ